jgi:hypothetical protein
MRLAFPRCWQNQVSLRVTSALALCCSFACSPAADPPAASGGSAGISNPPPSGGKSGSAGSSTAGSGGSTGTSGSAGSAGDSTPPGPIGEDAATPTTDRDARASADVATRRDGAGTAARDASADAPPPPPPISAGPCPANALFCDDFENPALPGWTKIESGGTLTIDPTHFVSGKSALSVNIPGNMAGGWLERKGAPLFPLPANAIYGRLMVYFDNLVPGHSDVVRGAATGGNTPWYNVGAQSGDVLLNYYTSGSDCWARPAPSKKIPLKTWMCWEWAFDGAKNEMDFYIDGVLSRKVTGSGDGCSGNNTWTAPTFASLRIGEYIAQRSNTPHQMWIDDVAVSVTGRVACPGAAPAAP